LNTMYHNSRRLYWHYIHNIINFRMLYYWLGNSWKCMHINHIWFPFCYELATIPATATVCCCCLLLLAATACCCWLLLSTAACYCCCLSLLLLAAASCWLLPNMLNLYAFEQNIQYLYLIHKLISLKKIQPL